LRVALLADTHWGARNDSPAFLDYFEEFHRDQLIPVIRDQGIRTLVHLGDVVDRRKYVSYQTAKRMREAFFEPMAEEGVVVHAIVGNHDTTFRNTNEVNSLRELVHERYPNLHVHTWPTEIDLGGRTALLLPWICEENHEASLGMISRSSADVVFGHLELRGYTMYRGREAEHGMEDADLQRFPLVCSGHYHHRSSRGSVHYLGAPYEMTWMDFGDDRGFHVLETDDLSLEYHRNPGSMFHRLVYDDLGLSMDEVLGDGDFSRMSGRQVKLVVQRRENPYWFELLHQKLEGAGATVQVVDETQTVVDGEVVVDEAVGTLDMVMSYVDELGMEDPSGLKTLLGDLYREASQLTSEG
jgi:DNA repair exonuclease SbcCD nuclease subunit